MVKHMLPLILVAFMLCGMRLPGTGKEMSGKELSEKNEVIESKENKEMNLICDLYSLCNDGGDSISYKALKIAFSGYTKLVDNNTIESGSPLTVVDFSKPSDKARMYIIDPVNKVLMFKTLVAHGKNSGEKFAERFSNTESSLMSSLGFYVTGETYIGKHDYSLKLDGLEPGINDNARKRGVVVHGASYVNDQFIQAKGMIGRSFGCPAIPDNISKAVIDKISNKSCLFIYSPEYESSLVVSR